MERRSKVIVKKKKVKVLWSILITNVRHKSSTNESIRDSSNSERDVQGEKKGPKVVLVGITK